ncbi:schwannomin-interacting protein 1, partial [Brachyistius frenatus]|uniref:schwannomin-interacting protein 1 n=1 Tax=Brachyistius frenatus TaxID=100188 RepID=UPI0037E8C03B
KEVGLRPEGRGGEWRDVWEDEEDDFRRCRVAVVASRLQNQRKLQLCFINEEEEQEEEAEKEVPTGTGHNGCHAAGLKQEVVTALRTLRDKLLSEQKECLSSSCVSERRHLDRWDLQDSSLQHLDVLRASLQQDVHALSSDLVAELLIRDQLRTKQDAMLLDVQDLT